MSGGTFFVQPCPTCGRRLQVRVEHLGRKVMCPHCRAWLTAMDPSTTRGSDASQGLHPLLRRAEELLSRSEQHVVRRRDFPPR